MKIRIGKSHAQAGFSLLEVMIVTGLIAVAALGFGELLRNTGKASRNIAVSTDFSNLSAIIGQVLSQQVSCGELLKEKLVPPAVAVAGLTLADATVAGWAVDLPDLNFTIPAQLGPPPIPAMPYNMVIKNQINQGLRVKTIRLTGPVVPMGQTGAAPAVYDVFMVHLIVEADRLGQPIKGGVFPNDYEKLGASISHDFGITMVTDPAAAGAVVNCYRDPVQDASVICNDLHGDWLAGGSVCDLSKAICERVGGVPGGVAGARTCDYGGGGTPANKGGTAPVDINQVVCNGIGGNYAAGALPGNSRCTFAFGPRDENGPGSLVEACKVMGGVYVGNGPAPPNARCHLPDILLAPAATDKLGPVSAETACKAIGGSIVPVGAALYCDACTVRGGDWNTLVVPPVCDMSKATCFANGGTFTQGVPPAFGTCNPSNTGAAYDPVRAVPYAANMCNLLGMNWDLTLVPPRCVPSQAAFRHGPCHSLTLGASDNDHDGAYTSNCAADEYVHQITNIAGTVNHSVGPDSYWNQIVVECCKTIGP